MLSGRGKNCVADVCSRQNSAFQDIVSKATVFGKYNGDAKQQIKKTQLFKVLQCMPKGSLLHAHFPAMVDWRVYLHSLIASPLKDSVYFLEKPGLALSSGSDVWTSPNNAQPIKFTLSVFPGGYHPPGWKLLEYTDIEVIADVLSSSRDWAMLELNAERTWSLIKHTGTFEIYVDLLFKLAIEDNVQHIELKTNLGALHTKHFDHEKHTYSGVWLGAEEEIARIDRIYDKYRSRISMKLILGAHRSLSKKDMSLKLSSAIDLWTHHNDMIGGVDIFGEEDQGNTNKLYLESLQKMDRVSTPDFVFSIHSGETSMVQFPVDTNVEVLMDFSHRVRIGHGLSIWKYPILVDLMRNQKLRHIELAPLSNVILGYVNTMSNHPGINYLLNGISISISSDDPSFFGYDSVAYDWYYAVTNWRLTLQEVLMIALNSIQFSAMNGASLDKLHDQFVYKFMKWIDNFIEVPR